MKKSMFLLAVALTFSACAGSSHVKGNSEIFGKVAVIDVDGENITRFCRTVAGNGLLVQKAALGDTPLKQITCINGQYVYRIKPDGLRVAVPEENVAVYFGDITIRLQENGSYGIDTAEGRTSGLYQGSLRVVEGAVRPSGELAWNKNYLGGDMER